MHRCGGEGKGKGFLKKLPDHLDPERPATWPRSAREYLRRRQEPFLGHPDLEALIQQRIRSEGPMPFAAFMELALYHPEYGYYNNVERPRIGPSGDFLTSPETHPAFGFLLARRLLELWQGLACPPEFTVVEMGPGSGSLAGQILAAAPQHSRDFAAAMRYALIETSPSFQVHQKERLSSLEEKVVWWKDLSEAQGLVGCFLSNELVDAFPVHRVRMEGGELQEYYVILEGDRFTEVPGKPSTPELKAYFEEPGVLLPEGCRAEVNLKAKEWIASLGMALKRGFVLTIDYGHLAHELYSARFREGTLLCYYRHTLTDNPYIRVGRQDITAHVDFSCLMRAGAKAGLKAVQYETQRNFLLGLGFQERLRDEPRGPGFSALQALIAPERLGKLKVLIQLKG